MERIKDALMARDGMTDENAEHLISIAVKELKHRLDTGHPFPEDVCLEYLQLEDDFVYELIDRLW